MPTLLPRASRKLGPRLARRLGRRRGPFKPGLSKGAFWRRIRLFLPLAMAGGLTLLLQNSGIWASMRSAIESLDFDPSRAALILAWLAGAVLASLATLLTGRPWISAIAATGFVAATYVWPLGEQIRRQPPDIFGIKQTLQPATLWHNQAVALGVALTAALIMAATADLLRRSGIDFGRRSWRLLRSPQLRLGALLGLAAAGGIGVTAAGALVLAAEVDPVLRFGPEHGVYRATSISVRPAPADSGRLAGLEPPEPIPSQGQVISRTYRSAAMGEDRPFRVYLPPTYGLRRSVQRYYPVLYLLHGDPGSLTDWEQFGATGVFDTGISAGVVPETIVIFPDGNGHVTASTQWANRFDGRDRVEDALLELVDAVDHEFRTVPDRSHRIIGGLSSGGFGAVNIAARHPDSFGVAMSFSGYFHANGPVFGGSPGYVRANSPYFRVQDEPTARSVHYILVVGDRDPYYRQENRSFAGQLDRLGVPHVLDLLSGGHSADIWQKGLEMGMRRMAQTLSGAIRLPAGGRTHGIQF